MTTRTSTQIRAAFNALDVKISAAIADRDASYPGTGDAETDAERLVVVLAWCNRTKQGKLALDALSDERDALRAELEAALVSERSAAIVASDRPSAVEGVDDVECEHNERFTLIHFEWQTDEGVTRRATFPAYCESDGHDDSYLTADTAAMTPDQLADYDLLEKLLGECYDGIDDERAERQQMGITD